MRLSTLCTALLAAALASLPAQAAPLGFDDLSGDGLTPVADGYAGLRFANAASIAAAALPGSGYAVAAVSGPNAAFSLDGGEMQISRADGGLFHVAGGWFTSAWQEQELLLEGWLAGALVYSSAPLAIGTGAALQLQLDWQGIDQLVIANSLAGAPNGHWAVDDLAITLAVPEPGSAALVAAALGVAALGRRRRPAARSTLTRTPA
ncbi:PEP-CTERM sorting domain-containing protein [Aquabacterium sp. OR-4]|uniref:PEP-CTERM sorting domain-containing protein n=1 Tax=Aquabacterium sp. OR-4 TaxID=2978127 RepID=UPI0021B27D86|nr:PEP-CTERM sorting domain-containing protein [Aquabacterium sp. OR-4]MDT7836521.1 PEP-CTERM sorting domain-containing protein [Aquabacterium sp. OR-4]